MPPAAWLADVLPDAGSLKTELNVLYGSGHEVSNGAALTKSQAANAPSVAWQPAEDRRYALACVDPDAPSPDNPVAREWLHWLVVNIPGADVSSGAVVTPYNGPTPPKGTHRYIFALFEQPQGVTLPSEHITNRKGFKLAEWAAAHKLGGPVGALHYTTAAGSE